ncbi:hypothetical protein HHK36_002201 [Tetracentron sinense]|uniref:F-box domain-containing protein n=1 Tax=Tetracentron sinense TaxID=13715 RepID=A0A835A440_TETSI|nr:hypothetical protein HHK36_002201 [Tetracentron sinense]
MANLPQDVIMEILSRVPVKSLLRFRCVSKTWCSFVANPSFAKKHLNQATQNNNPSLIFSHCFNLYSIDYEESDVAAVKLDLPFTDFIDRVELSGSCNGLVCISDHSRNEDIYLCNPSNREYMKLPVPCFDVPTNEHTCFTSLGFGYHPAMDDYKVIRIIYLYDKPLKNIDSYECEARIYSLGTNSWRKIGHVPLHVSTRCSVVLGNGILLWKASRGNGLTIAITYMGTLTSFASLRTGTEAGEQATISEIWVLKDYVKEQWVKEYSISMKATGRNLDNAYVKHSMSAVIEGARHHSRTMVVGKKCWISIGYNLYPASERGPRGYCSYVATGSNIKSVLKWLNIAEQCFKYVTAYADSKVAAHAKMVSA